MDLPKFDWPTAEPPKYEYPFEENLEYNRKADEVALAGVEQAIKEHNGPIAACVLEPI